MADMKEIEPEEANRLIEEGEVLSISISEELTVIETTKHIIEVTPIGCHGGEGANWIEYKTK